MFSTTDLCSQGPDPLSGDEPARMFGPDLSDSDRRTLVMKAYKTLKSQWERFRRPDGGRDYPAKTCRDLHVAHPELPSGDYWVDPNEGDVRDAILVHCNMVNKATCLYPQPNRTPEITYVGEDQEIWVADVEGGMKVSNIISCSHRKLTWLRCDILSNDGHVITAPLVGKHFSIVESIWNEYTLTAITDTESFRTVSMITVLSKVVTSKIFRLMTFLVIFSMAIEYM